MMENEKLFEFMEKIYGELQSTKIEMQNGFRSVNSKIDGLEDAVKKNSIKLETLEKKIDTIVEVQSNHIKQNENNHVEIVEMLSGEIELTQQAVSKITAIK